MNHCPNPDVDRDPALPERGRLPESTEIGAVSVDTTALDLFRSIAAALHPGRTRETVGYDGARRAAGGPGSAACEESGR
ncbi:hypothetical protein ACWCPM_17815 [Streptomyces sp. NPDC002309]